MVLHVASPKPWTARPSILRAAAPSYEQLSKSGWVCYICAVACVQVFVVELQRKPLFPGIYTPVLVLKNEALIKEVMEAKKHG